MKRGFHKDKVTSIYILFLAFMLTAGCHDIFEDNIEGKKVILTSPKDYYHTSNPKVTLTWEYLDGATAYNLKIVSPSFAPDSIEKIVLDTNITVNSYAIILDKGKYQWGVKAWNSVSKTDMVFRNIFVDSVAVPVVILLNPADKKAIKDTTVSFSWNGADNSQYIFSLNFGGQLLYNTITASKNITLPTAASTSFTLDEGSYTWQVQARNTGGGVSELETRTFTIDRTAPGKPTLLLPKNDSLFSTTPVTLTWKQQTDAGSALYDSVYIASDSVFANLKEADKIVNNSSVDFSPQTNGTYYWRVRTYDMAGNASLYSNRQKFRYNAK